MTNFSSIGDLSRSFHTRLANVTMKSRLDTLTNEVTSGLKSDLARSLNGDLSRINHLQTRLSQLDTYDQNIATVQGRLSGMQGATETIQNLLSSLAPTFLSEARSASPETLALRVSAANEDFNTVIRALNTEVAGKFIFSGTRTDVKPLSSRDDIQSALLSEVAGLGSTADILTAIDNWFDGPAGSGGFIDTAYHGSIGPMGQVPVNDTQLAGTNARASDTALREVLKGFAIISVVAASPGSYDIDETRDLLHGAAERLHSGNFALTNLRADIGISEHAVERTKVQNTAERATLTISRGAIIAADPYETALALKEAETGMQNIFALTARLSKLNLADYL